MKAYEKVEVSLTPAPEEVNSKLWAVA